MPTRILIHAVSAQQGGGQTYILNLVRGTDPAQNIHFYITVTPQNRKIFESLPGVTLICSKFAGRSLIHRFLWENFRLPSILKKFAVNVLLAPAGILPKLYLPKSCRYITVCQNMLPFSPAELARSPSFLFRLKFHILRYSQIFSFRKSDLVIFISQYARQTILPLLKKEVRSATIPHGLPDEFRRPSLAPSPFAFEYVLYVSSFFEYKAHLQVIESWIHLNKKQKRNEKLVLLGYDQTSYGALVRQKIQELGQSDSILVLSSVPYQTLPAYYQHAKALIFASSCENCPNILLESMASGRPVLSSHYPPMPEFADQAALYFDPYQPEQLSSRLHEVLDNPQLQTSLAEKAQRTVAPYTIEKSVSQTWKSILDVLK